MMRVCTWQKTMLVSRLQCLLVHQPSTMSVLLLKATKLDRSGSVAMTALMRSLKSTASAQPMSLVEPLEFLQPGSNLQTHQQVPMVTVMPMPELASE